MHVHGNNLKQKEEHRTKYQSAQSRQYLSEIRDRYDKWNFANESLKGPFGEKSPDDDNIITKRVVLLNEYKDFLDQQHYAEEFDSRSNLHSSVLEEFMYFLFKDMVNKISKHALLGKSRSFKDIFFKASSFVGMLKNPTALIERKDHDFAIGASVDAKLACKGNMAPEEHSWDIPAVAIECKTYLDKTMLQDVSTAAEQIKMKNPNAMYIVVAEWIKLTDAVNLKKFKVDQIYILRKQKNTDREFRYEESYNKNPIYDDVVNHCFEMVRDFLTSDWSGGIEEDLENGYLI